jgi:hypothetical protein
MIDDRALHGQELHEKCIRQIFGFRPSTNLIDTLLMRGKLIRKVEGKRAIWRIK